MTVNICRIIGFEIRNEPFVSAIDLNEHRTNDTSYKKNTPGAHYEICPCTRSEGL